MVQCSEHERWQSTPLEGCKSPDLTSDHSQSELSGMSRFVLLYDPREYRKHENINIPELGDCNAFTY